MQRIDLGLQGLVLLHLSLQETRGEFCLLSDPVRREDVGIGKLNYCLKALIDKGWVKVGNFSHSKNKMNYAYLLTPKGISEKARMTQGFLYRKIEEYEALRKEIDLLKNEILQSGDSR